MSAQLPRKLKNYAVVVDGDKTAGTIDEVTLPKLTRKMEEYRGGGMSAPIKVDLGMEALEASISSAEWDDKLIRHFGDCDVNGIPVRFLGYQERDDGSCSFDRIEVAMRGRWSELDFGNAKTGEMNSLKATIPLAYYKLMINGEVIIEIEPLAMIEKIGGKDRLLERRAAMEL
jgi:P2 family phage contractile tail tube protein